MRLIDADALKEKIVKLCRNINANKGITIPTLTFTRIIDNATTVPLPDFKEGYKKAIIDGKTNFSRPQGEWNYIQAGMCVCPFCGATPHKEYKNFCPNCGADMRGSE